MLAAAGDGVANDQGERNEGEQAVKDADRREQPEAVAKCGQPPAPPSSQRGERTRHDPASPTIGRREHGLIVCHALREDSNGGLPGTPSRGWLIGASRWCSSGWATRLEVRFFVDYTFLKS